MKTTFAFLPLVTVCWLGAALVGCQPSNDSPATENASANRPATNSTSPETSEPEQQSSTEADPDVGKSQDDTEANNKPAKNPLDRDNSAAADETAKPMKSPAEDDQLPSANISPEASDLDVEPTYVNMRKHDPVFQAEEHWKKLTPDYPIWIDQKAKQVIVDGRIAQENAILEMFACPVDSGKEHESIVGLYCESELIHAALLAVGATAGQPVQFQPEFKPPTGTTVAIEVIWEKDGKLQSADAKSWIRNRRTNELLDTDWVFGGSQIIEDEESGNRFYLANSGETVCVSNFSTAMLDLPIESSANAAQNEYQTNTDAIPVLGTPVRLIFKPVLEKENAAEETAAQTNENTTGQPAESSTGNQSDNETGGGT